MVAASVDLRFNDALLEQRGLYVGMSTPPELHLESMYVVAHVDSRDLCCGFMVRSPCPCESEARCDPQRVGANLQRLCGSPESHLEGDAEG